MKIYCDKCNENHEFSSADIEFLIYGLQASYTHESNSGNNHDLKEKYGWKPFELDCLKEALSYACDLEGFAEHTNSMRDSRVAHELAEMGWHMGEAVSQANFIIERDGL